MITDEVDARALTDGGAGPAGGERRKGFRRQLNLPYVVGGERKIGGLSRALKCASGGAVINQPRAVFLRPLAGAPSASAQSWPTSPLTPATTCSLSS